MLLADRHPVFREALLHAVEHETDHRVVARTDDGEDCLDAVRALAPHLVVLGADLVEPDAAELVRRLVDVAPTCGVVVLLDAHDPDAELRFVLAGAAATVPRGDVVAALPELLDRMAAGAVVVGPDTIGALLAVVDAEAATEVSPAERSLLAALADGTSPEQAARAEGMRAGATGRALADIVEKVRRVRRRQSVEAVLRSAPPPDDDRFPGPVR